jgi:hypothetical protein
VCEADKVQGHEERNKDCGERTKGKFGNRKHGHFSVQVEGRRSDYADAYGQKEIKKAEHLLGDEATSPPWSCQVYGGKRSGKSDQRIPNAGWNCKPIRQDSICGRQKEDEAAEPPGLKKGQNHWIKRH